MEEWEKDVIRENLDKLIHNTKVNETVLAKFQASRILGENDITDLKVHCNNPVRQASEFYRIIQSRVLGYQTLLKALSETNQSGALSILTSIPLNYVNSFRYDENSKLGKGAFATVFKGEFNGRAVAVKRIFSTDEQEKTRINNEIEIFKLVDEHPNVVQAFSSQHSAHFTLIVLELCDMTLKEWVQKKNLVPIPQREVLRQITEGLNWLHQQKVLYRGVRPENILIKERTKIFKISGFGMSTRVEEDNQSSIVSASELEGNLGWEAPEVTSNFQLVLQKENQEDNDNLKCIFASDVYSLGCMFFYVLTDGENNFADINNIEELEDTLENDDCIKDIQIIRQMISKDPETRPTCSALLSSQTLHNKPSNQRSDNQLVLSHQSEPPILAYLKKNKISNENCLEIENNSEKNRNEFNPQKLHEAIPTKADSHRMLFDELEKCVHAIEEKQRAIESIENEKEGDFMKHFEESEGDVEKDELENERKKEIAHMEKRFKIELKNETDKMMNAIKRLKLETTELAESDEPMKMLRQQLEEEKEMRRVVEMEKAEEKRKAEVQKSQTKSVRVELQKLDWERMDMMQKMEELETLVKTLGQQLGEETERRKVAEMERDAEKRVRAEMQRNENMKGEDKWKEVETKSSKETARKEGQSNNNPRSKQDKCSIA